MKLSITTHIKIFDIKTVHNHNIVKQLNPFTDEQINLLGTLPKQVCHNCKLVRFCGALKLCSSVKGLRHRYTRQ